MTFDERVQAVASFGFSDRQTRFLVTVALHSGFCLRRHYAAFAGLRSGQGVRDFLERLVDRRLATSATFRRDRGRVYHLHARRLYTAIGQDDNRNRRTTSPALIARKLMLLDYVLGAPPMDWYATEADEVALFTTRLGVPLADLPQRLYRAHATRVRPTTRYFIHKLPIALAGDPAVASFVFLATETTGRGLAQFLDDHARLLSHLPHWRVIAVCPPHIPGLAACERVFRRFCAAGSDPRRAADPVALQQYFVARDLHERGDLGRLSTAQIDTFRAARRRYTAPAFESLYRQWQHDGALPNTGAANAIAAAVAAGRGQLVTHRLPIQYDRFGTRAGVA
jgi:hypothetical protein